MAAKEYYCPKHPLTVLVCPRCIAARGGKATAKKYGSVQLSRWGAAGGRPPKKKRKARPHKIK
jgi:hypothetical protein